MFEIVGDEIRFDGNTVATFAPGTLATVRANVEDALWEFVDPDEVEEDHSECEADADALREELAEAVKERDDIELKLIDAREKRDAYACILGVEG